MVGLTVEETGDGGNDVLIVRLSRERDIELRVETIGKD